MMGGQSSKARGRDRDSPSPPPTQSNTNSDYKSDLNAYMAACQLDPDLQLFDANLHQKTNHVINTLAAGGVNGRALSFDSLQAVTGCLLDINQDVVKVILDSREDIWNNKELSGLVEEYFDNSFNTLGFCTALENCLKRARNSQLIIQAAVKQFEEEEQLQDGVVEKKYMKTLGQLQRFKESGNPFTEEFFNLFGLVHKQHVSMLQKLRLRKKKLDKKMKSMKTWRKVSNVLFVSAFVSVLIFSVVAAAISAPPVVIALASALAVPIGSVGKWCNSLWNKYEKELKLQRELITSMWIGTRITITDMDGIRVLINRLELKIQSIVENADVAIIDEDAMELVIDEIKKKLEVFMQTIEDLGARASKCSREITQARIVILERIMRYPDN